MSAEKTASPGKTTSNVDPRTIQIVRWSLLALVVVVLLLVFAVPRRPPPPPSPAQPEEAFVDRTGLVSPKFAREWAGALLNDPRFEMVIYVDERPPPGDLVTWTIQSASDWRIGTGKRDTGLVLFVFRQPRIARVEVGYGLEPTLTDARVRQLLEAHLAPAFGRGEYERGFDAFIKSVRDEMGGDAAIARALEEQVKTPDEPLLTQAAGALARAPRLVSATVSNYLEGNAAVRIVVLVMSSVALAIMAFGAFCAANTLWRLVTFRRKFEQRKAGGRGVAIAANLFEIAMGIAGFFICLAMIVVVLLAAESFVTRKGSFSGAGAAIVWPAR
jgi:uncharacterized membrane protein YgcG